MIIEYFNNDVSTSYQDLKNELSNPTIIKNIDSVCLSYHNAKYIKSIIQNNSHKKILIGTYIDYPLGIADHSTRINQLIEIVKLGIDFINISMQTSYLTNKKYDKIRAELTEYNNICKPQNIEIRYNLEYRQFDHTLLKKICTLLKMNNINKIYPSSGFFLDDINDNIIACKFLSNETGILSFCTGKAWTKQHIDNIIKSKLYGVSTNSIHTISEILSSHKNEAEQ